jgi:uncharacterized repeat protein (TIGR01451 family)
MKRNCFRIGVLGTAVILCWIAVTYGGNPLRNQAQPLVPDTIPDASPSDSATVEVSAAADASDVGRPGLLAPPAVRQPIDRNATENARTAAAGDDDRYYGNRNAAPRAASDNDEPGRINSDVFEAPSSIPPATAANQPAPRSNTLRPVATPTITDNNANYNALPNNVVNANNANNVYNANNGIGPNTQARPNNNLAPNTITDRNNTLGQANPAADGVGQPGAKQLEGLQCPQVTIQKLAPSEVQVGRPASFKTIVRNTGSIPAGQVEIRDLIPRGTRLISTTPKATSGTRGEIVWTLGTLRPGEESAVEMELMPVAEGEIGSVATVHFGADASAKTVCTRPDIAVVTTAPAQALIGEKVTMTITVTNPGSGVATGVVLEEHIPAGLQHPAGSELEYKIGTLRPGESKKLDLELVAAAAGPITNLLSVRADGNLRHEDRLQMEVVAPKLDIALEGPKKRYLEREATYQLSVSNPGTAAAQGVELVAYLPTGMKFVSANNQGHYDEANRAVYWRLEQLPTRDTGTVELVALPIEAGQQNIKLRGTAQRVPTVEKEQPVTVEGIAAVMFQVGDSVDPIEVGGETTYEVRVVNQGSKAAGNVQLTAVLPPEMKPLAADGPTRYSVQGNAVIFEGLARLAPKTETLYHVRVKTLRPGDLHAQFKLMTDEMQRPVTKEESTQVYADE